MSQYDLLNNYNPFLRGGWLARSGHLRAPLGVALPQTGQYRGGGAGMWWLFGMSQARCSCPPAAT